MNNNNNSEVSYVILIVACMSTSISSILRILFKLALRYPTEPRRWYGYGTFTAVEQ